MKTVVNGQSIDRFIPAHLRDIFYHNSEPKYKYAISNGYAPYDFSTNGLVLYLPLWALKGDSFKSVDAYKTTATVTTATWTPAGRDFVAATPDYITIPAADTTGLDFTSGDFSVIVRAKPDIVNALTSFIGRGIGDGDGWEFFTHSTNRLALRTNQAGANQATYSAAQAIAADTWHTLGVSRTGATVNIYVNGVVDNDIAGDHTNPLTSARSVKIGVYDNLTSQPFDGIMSDILVYGRSLSVGEHLDVHKRLSWRV